jgi:CTD small phosphatase-like protein 2
VLNRNLSEIVLVDNSPFAYVLQPENGVPILPFEGCHRDCQLKMLEEYLMRLEGVQDVREVNARSFGLNRYGEFREPGELIAELYKGRR